MIHLSGDRLKLSFLEPGEGTNNKTRFDRAGYLQQVTLDGEHTFCGVEPGGGKFPNSGGAGLCSEIQCDELSYGLAEGEIFPKFGVGLLTQAGGREYRFFREYPCDPFDVTCSAEDKSIVFSVAPKEHNGIALEEKLVFTIEGNTLVKEYYFKNTGTKTLVISEYCHNFLSLDGEEVTSAFSIDLPMLSSQQGMMPRSPEGRMRGCRTGFCFVDTGSAPSTIRPNADQIDRSGPFTWTVRSRTSNLSVTGTVSFHPQQLAMWSSGNVLSPEIFHRFGLAPRERIRYWRSWSFNAGK